MKQHPEECQYSKEGWCSDDSFVGGNNVCILTQEWWTKRNGYNCPNFKRKKVKE